ncbi:hypothetical protein V9L05_15165 [Bernardetia sp. Wsw4-3y2]|uniref:hypothetical protein n=1 Tax=Bernardetia sp. Wsw4-3y2 TaxID=3127471 RepID=UPI0030CF80A9
MNPINNQPEAPKIELKESFLNRWIDSISSHVGTNSVLLGFTIRLILFFIVASLVIKEFWEDYPWLGGGIVALVFFADIGFTLSALMAAKFYNSKVMLYARTFFGISLFGLAFICWKLYDFTDLIYPINISDAELDNVKYLRYSLNAIFFTSAILAFLFTEGGAYMIFTLTSKENRNNETSETRNSETHPKHSENNVSQEYEEDTQGKIEDLELPNKIEKTGENKFSINGELPKNIEGFKGNVRAHASKKRKFLENGEYRNARNAEVWEDYYSAIVAIIEAEEAKNKTSWSVYPNGSMKVESESEPNGHKLKPEFFQ